MRSLKYYGICWLLLSVSTPIAALEKTVLIDVQQSWYEGALSAGKLSASLELSNTLGDNSALTAIVRGQVFDTDELEPGIPDQDSVVQISKRIYLTPATELELRELYLDVDFESASLRLGKQQVVWGQADGLKLLDVVNPQDFREFILDDFDHSRIPLWMVNFETFLPIGDLQVLWIPDTTMHNLPEAGALFEMTAPFANIPEDTPVFIEPINRPDSLGDGDFGLRLSMFQAGWDITANYLYRYDDFPVVKKQFEADGLHLSPGFERTHTVGASASNAFGDFILRTELALNTDKYFTTKTIKHNGGVEPSNELGYVVGLDWTGLTDTFASMQLFQSVLLDNADYVRPKTDTNLTFLLRRNFMNESLNTELLWIYHENDGDNLLRFSFDYELTSNISVGAYADFFSGEPDELFGQFRHRDRVGIRLSVGF